jgi:hypothetical protein
MIYVGAGVVTAASVALAVCCIVSHRKKTHQRITSFNEADYEVSHNSEGL